jgi:hypothetical protein
MTNKPDDGPWIVGRLHDPQPDDTQYSNTEAAIEAAWNLANSDWNDVYAVWDSRDSVVWIFTYGKQFAPATDNSGAFEGDAP